NGLLSTSVRGGWNSSLRSRKRRPERFSGSNSGRSGESRRLRTKNRELGTSKGPTEKALVSHELVESCAHAKDVVKTHAPIGADRHDGIDSAELRIAPLPNA